ncbi:MAG: hypothetical protein WC700_08965 [Gemmatimonadaceae bacterium]|jgi:hypothetical protein
MDAQTQQRLDVLHERRDSAYEVLEAALSLIDRIKAPSVERLGNTLDAELFYLEALSPKQMKDRFNAALRAHRRALDAMEATAHLAFDHLALANRTWGRAFDAASDADHWEAGTY